MPEKARSSHATREYDVIVAGGGAAGMIAAVAAARQGARTLLLERQGCLGGTATTGYVAQYLGFYNGDRRVVGGIPYDFVREIEAAGGSSGFGTYVLGEASANPVTLRHFSFNPEVVKIVADELAIDAGVDLLFHANVVDVTISGQAVGGVTVETIAGRRTYSAPVMVDATGDATVAALAGAEMQPAEDERQPNTLVFRLSNVDVERFRALPREIKRAKALEGLKRGELFWESTSFCSTPAGTDAICLMSRITGMDALDPEDASAQERVGRAQVKSIVGFLNREMPGFENAVLASIAPRVGVRETRRILGRYTLTAEDILGAVQFEDSIALGAGPMDTHESAGTGVKLFMPKVPFEIPMRCSIPARVEGLVVTGRAISATREANGGARHMGTAMALGQAAGVMAALSVSNAVSTHDLSAELVQDVLREQNAEFLATARDERTNPVQDEPRSPLRAAPRTDQETTE